MTSSARLPETIDRLNGVATQHCALLAAIQLDIFTSLKDVRLTVEQCEAELRSAASRKR